MCACCVVLAVLRLRLAVSTHTHTPGTPVVDHCDVFPLSRWSGVHGRVSMLLANDATPDGTATTAGAGAGAGRVGTLSRKPSARTKGWAVVRDKFSTPRRAGVTR